jgi:hypothetical protein
MKHSVYRAYIGLARAEHFTASEIGETLDFVGAYSGKLIDSFPTAQFNWREDADLKEAVCGAWVWTDTQFDESLIIKKPTCVQNLLFCSKLRELFGVGRLRFIDQFDNGGIFKLPAGPGFLEPRRDDGRIASLDFYPYSSLKRKAA